MRIQIEERTASLHRQDGPVFFASGFRPFFLFAGIQAATALPIWLALYFGLFGLGLEFAPVHWHAHEMVFGFGTAAIGGFLLTAVPNWTGAASIGGPRLMLLFGLWLAGRLAFWGAGVLPPTLVAVADLAFLPVLGFMLARALILAGKLRNIIFLPILGVLWLANLLVHLELMDVAASATAGVTLGIYVLVLMIAIVGGRIVPAFTGTALRLRRLEVEIRAWGWLELAAPVSVAAVAVLELALPASTALGIVALVAGALHALRMSGWHGWRTLDQPIVWVLHAGYAWLTLGLALRGLSFLTDAVPPSAALHAFTVGAVGSMVLGVMTRAALGHSGRPLQVAGSIAVAYGLVQGAALARVAPPILAPGLDPLLSMGASGLLWTAAFVVFAVVYFPVVTRPRLDGRPG